MNDLNIFNNIFQNQDDSLSFLIDNEIIPRALDCQHCMGHFRSMQIRKYKVGDLEKFIYRCTRCSARKGLLSLGTFKTGKLKLNTYLGAIYLFVLDVKLVQVYNIIGI